MPPVNVDVPPPGPARPSGAAPAPSGLTPLFQPRSIALVGASRQPGSIGAALLRNLRSTFRGPIYPINPKAETIDGLRAWPTVAAIGAPVDLALVVVAAELVEAAVADCLAAGTRGLCVISGGFAEMSAAGAETQKRIAELARAAGVRMVGPNCMGLLDTDPAWPLNATFAPVFPPPGNVGVLSQSGALGLVVLDHAREIGLGVSTFVSVGNKADVSGNDLLGWWRDDPRTDVIALYLESFGNPRRFARLARDVARQKPIVAVKSGRTAAGTLAASSHSAALACADEGVDALFEESGVIRTDTLEELFDVVSLLSCQPLPQGGRVGIVTNAGGPGILLADACEAHGLALPALQASTERALRSFLPAHASARNPVDMIASAGPDEYAWATAAVGNDPAVDAVVVIVVPPPVSTMDDVARGIARGAEQVPAAKPVLTVFLSPHGAPAGLASGARGRLPAYTFPENAARALAAAQRYARWRARRAGTPLVLGEDALAAARALVQRHVRADGGAAWMPAPDVDALLRAIGVTTAASRVVAPEAAPAAAGEIGYPVVAKAVAPGLVHRSDVGAVVLDLHSPQEVHAAVAGLRARVPQMEGVLLQQQVAGGVEAIVGVVADPSLGPLVVAGLGGREVELLKDVSFRLAPVTDTGAADMLDRLRMRPLLEGYRGAPAVDRAALVDVIQRVAALADAVPEIRTMDLNPVKVLREGVVVVDARVQVAAARG